MKFWFALALAGCCALAQPAAAADLVVGQVAPLSGVLASTGKDLVLGSKIYFDHVNAQGGIHGRKIRHVVRDDGYKTEETVRLTREVLDKDGAVALIGFAGTGNVGELLKQKVLADAGVALVAPFSGGMPLREPFNANVFHIRAGYAEEVEAMVKHFAGLGLNRFAVLYQDDPFGQSGLAAAEKAAKAHAVSIVARGSYEKNTDKVEAAVKTIAKADPQVVIMVSVTRSTAAFVKQYRATGLFAMLVNLSVADGPEMARLVGAPVVSGTAIMQIVPSPHFDSLPVVREYKSLLKKYGPAGAELDYTTLEQFIGAKVLVEGLRRAGPNPSREKVLHALEALNSHDVGGFTVTFSGNNRIGSRFVEMTSLNGEGKLVR